ncbi:melatonin receptor type 1B-B [Nematostella vectensis]|uniref:melatonin receptor type 1B-B n=1 Tax=Nematostella vectensis TaxID=45351 RepID=UPI0020772F8A|nr:melatonin receptor type 1B-B [Nematostella vectensis]
MNSTEAELWPNLYIELRSRGLTTIVFESTLIILINISALVGNFFTCWVIYKDERLHTITYGYIGALAMSDLLYACLVNPLIDASLVTGEWNLGKTACQVQAVLCIAFAWNSLHLMTLISVNRYFRVIRSEVYRRRFSWKLTAFLIGASLFCAVFSSSFPYFPGWCEYVFQPGKAVCFMHIYDRYSSENRSFTLIMTVVYVIIPIIVISFCYARVFRVVKVQQKNLIRNLNRIHITSTLDNTRNVTTNEHASSITEGSVGSNTNACALAQLCRNPEEIRLNRVLLVLVLGCAICWLPVIIIEIIDTLIGSLPRAAHVLYTYLGSLSGAVNPLVYGIMNRKFRKEMLRLLRMCRPNKRTIVGPYGN